MEKQDLYYQRTGKIEKKNRENLTSFDGWARRICSVGRDGDGSSWRETEMGMGRRRWRLAVPSGGSCVVVDGGGAGSSAVALSEIENDGGGSCVVVDGGG